MIPVYFSYIQGAGGKALINCLSCSPQVLCNDSDLFARQITGKHDMQELGQKILSTVPDIMHDQWWSSYEIQNYFTGCDHPSQPQAGRQPLPDWAMSSDKFLPLVSHHPANLACYQNWLGHGPAIRLIPHVPFLDTAIRIKWVRDPDGPQPCLDLDQLETWKRATDRVEFDLTINDFDPLGPDFRDQVSAVARFLSITVDWSVAAPYLKKYQDYHWSKIRELNLESYAAKTQ